MSNFSQIKEATYWTEPHPTTKNYSNKPLPQKTDVLVIGSGYTGVVTGLQLKKAGVEVTLIDKGRIGSEASSKNGGMCLSGLSVALFKVKKKFVCTPTDTNTSKNVIRRTVIIVSDCGIRAGTVPESPSCTILLHDLGSEDNHQRS